MKRHLLAILTVLGITAAQAEDNLIYVKANAPNSGEPYATEDTAAPTLYAAAAYAKTQEGFFRIKVVGTVQETQASTIAFSNVELFGDSRTQSVVKGLATGRKPNVELGANAFVHDLKFDSWRGSGILTLTDDSACVSNCWLRNLYFSTAASPAISASKGLVTHTLITECYCNYGPVVTLSGTAKMRNCIFTGNRLNNGSVMTETVSGPIAMSGTAILENNVIYGNYAALRAEGEQLSAGILVSGGTPVIRNNIVRNNKINGTLVTGSECGFYVVAGTPVVDRNNSIEGFGENAQTDDPKFTDPDKTKPEQCDFTIAADSPCVDAGCFAEWQNEATDYSGVMPRYQGEGVDIGAYEVRADVTPAKPYAHVSGPLAGSEKYATVALTVSVAGLKLSSSAEVLWYDADPADGAAEPIATGKETSARFTAGEWSVWTKIVNADGAGSVLLAKAPETVSVLPGADYYVSAKGNDENSGDIDAPFKTVTHAVEVAKAGQRIKIVGTVNEYYRIELNGIELYGDSRETSFLNSTSTGYDYSWIKLGPNAFVHDLKMFGGSRGCGLQSSEETAVVSNCWVNGTGGVSGGTPACSFSAGLITHTLFTGCHINNSGSTVGSISGTAKMHNCVWTANRIDDNCRGDLNGMLSVSGTAELENCVIYGNKVKASSNGDKDSSGGKGRNGAGVYVPSGSPLIRNCIVRNNLKPHAYMEDPGEVDIYNPTEEGDFYIVANATPRIVNCNIPEGQVPEGATNCQTGDPKFTDPDNTTVANRDFSIAEDSPCVDAGNGRGWRKGATDYAGNPRIQGRRVDIGAYEYNSGVVDWGLQILVR